MCEKHFATHKNYVVATKCGNIISTHYSSTEAIAAAKSAKAHRNIHGRHRGYWKVLLSYIKGVKV